MANDICFRLRVCIRSSDYNIVFILLSAVNRKLAQSPNLRLLFKDGLAISVTTILKFISVHPAKYVKYKFLDLVDDRQAFFDNASVAFKNSIKTHIPSSCFDVIVFDMKFESVYFINNDEDDIESRDVFGRDVKRDVIHHQRSQKFALPKYCVMPLFRFVNHEVEYC